jgi:hypothetical protein
MFNSNDENFKINIILSMHGLAGSLKNMYNFKKITNSNNIK